MDSLVTLFFVAAGVMLLLGVPVSITIGGASLLYIFTSGMNGMVAVQKVFAGVNSVALLAIPFFVLAGDLMNTGGIAKRLVRLANAYLGHRTGGLATIAIVGCMFFAAISGSGVATAAAIGSILIPAMVSKGYERNFACSVIASSSPIGVVIPPSISFVVYGVLTGTSISDLYLAGIPAGIIMGISLMVTAYIISKKRGYKGVAISEDKAVVRKERRDALKDAIWAIITPLILIGGVFGGIFTPTESAVVAVVYAIIVGIFIYKDMKWSDIPQIFLRSAKTAVSIMFIIGNACLFAYVLTYERIPQQIVEGLLSLTTNNLVLLLIINLVLLVAGTFMETSAILIIMVPLLLPIINQMGMNLVHFGIMITVNTAIGLLTPPFGVCLFTTARIGGTSIEALSKKVGWFLLALIVSLLIITYVPQLVMFMVP